MLVPLLLRYRFHLRKLVTFKDRQLNLRTFPFLLLQSLYLNPQLVLHRVWTCLDPSLLLWSRLHRLNELTLFIHLLFKSLDLNLVHASPSLALFIAGLDHSQTNLLLLLFLSELSHLGLIPLYSQLELSVLLAKRFYLSLGQLSSVIVPQLKSTREYLDILRKLLILVK